MSADNFVTVQVLELIASPWGTAKPGETLDVPEDVGQAWKDAGVAREPIIIEEDPAPEAPADGLTVETATVAAPEKAVTGRKSKTKAAG